MREGRGCRGGIGAAPGPEQPDAGIGDGERTVRHAPHHMPRTDAARTLQKKEKP